MKQIHVYELTEEEIKSIDKIMREERKIGFELLEIDHIGADYSDLKPVRCYMVKFIMKRKAEKENVKK